MSDADRRQRGDAMRCDHIGCDADATVRLRVPRHHYGDTYACAAHANDLRDAEQIVDAEWSPGRDDEALSVRLPEVAS